MDFQQPRGPGLPPDTNHTPPPPNTFQIKNSEPQIPVNAFSIASMVLGILSVVLLCLVYFSPMFAGLSILFALLSKGYRNKMHGYALTGVVTSVIGLVCSIALWIGIFVFVFRMAEPGNLDSDFWRSYKETGEQIYGEDFDDMLKQIYGDDFNIDDYIKGGTLWLEQ